VLNIIKTILSIKIYINTRTILLPTIIFSLHSSTLFGTFQSLLIMISSKVYVASIWQVRIALASLNTCSTMSLPVAILNSVKCILQLYPSFNLKTSERQLFYVICSYEGLFIICAGVHNSIYSAPNSSNSKVHLNMHDRLYESFRSAMFLMKFSSLSQYLTPIYEAWSYLGDLRLLLPFNS